LCIAICRDLAPHDISIILHVLGNTRLTLFAPNTLLTVDTLNSRIKLQHLFESAKYVPSHSP